MAIRDYDRLFIGGDWVAPEGTDTISVISPSTEEVIARVPDGTEGDIDKAVAAARTAFDHGPWPRMTPAERAEILSKVAAQIMAEMDDMAAIITQEMGSPISFSGMGQVLAPTMIFNYYADLATTYAFDEVRAGMLNPQVLVTKEPVGVVGAIAPWNVPLFIAAAKLAPSLAAGCTVVYKPAPETPFDAFRLAEIFAEAGLPKGVLSVVPAGREVSEHLVKHPGVDKISFTGSGVGGKRIGGLCGERLKRCTLELGGKSAAIILDDADLATTIPTLLPNAIMNNGQACIAQTRILAPRSRYSEVVDAVVSGVVRHEGGRPDGPGHRGRPRGGGAATEPDRGVSRQRARRGRHRRPGGRSTLGVRLRQGLVRGAHGLLRRGQQNEDRPGGDLRAGARRHPLRRRRQRGGDRQRLRTTGCAARCGPATTTVAWVWRARCAPAPTCSMRPVPIDFSTPFGGYKESGVGREFGPEGLEGFLEMKSIALPAGYTPGA